MNLHYRRRSWISSAFVALTVLTTTIESRAQITIVDAGTDQPVASAHTNTTVPQVKLALPSVPSVSEDQGESMQVHASRVAALTNLSRTLRLSCTNQPPEIDKGIFERAAIRALALRRGLAELEQREKRLRQESTQRPNDGRIRAELASVFQNKQRLMETVTRDVSGKIGDSLRNVGVLRTSLCAELCSQGEKSPSVVDMCAFASPSLAHAAVISDHASVRGLATYIQHRFDSLRIVLPSKQALTLADIALADPDMSPFFAVADASSRVLDEQHTGLDVAAFTLGALDIGVRAVANLLVDRAKRESIVWLSRRLQEDICGGSSAKQQEGYGELRAYWFPTTCGLAGGTMGFPQYGNADWIRTVRGALATDISAWPGAAVGLEFGATLWADAKLDTSLFSCEVGAERPPACGAQAPDHASCEKARKEAATCHVAHEARLSGAKLVKDLASGANASLALYNVGADLDRLNAHIAVESGGQKFFSDRLQLLACAAAVPYIFQEYGSLVRQARPGKTEESKAILLAALTTAPACFSALGQGYSRNVCQGFSESTAGTVDSICPAVDPGKPLDPKLRPVAAAMRLGSIEKLTSILRWSRMVDNPAADLSTRWFAVVDAFRAYRNAVEEMTKGPPQSGLAVAPLDLSGLSPAHRVDEVFRAASSYVENTARLAERMPKLRVARASLVLGRASMDVALSFLESIDHSLGGQSSSGLFESWYEQGPNAARAENDILLQSLFPGFTKTVTLSPGALRTLFEQTTGDMRRLSEAIDTLDAMLAEDWNRVVARVVAGMRVDASRVCSSKRCVEACARGEGACGAVAQIGQYSGLFSALAFESDPERIAAAIDAAASPVGGYRRKNVPEAWTISLGSFVGLSGGAEFRFGPYGGRRENGKTPYLAAPTLTLPVGVDFARGFGTHNLGMFLSVVDPAAYFQYDVNAGATLPGAQLVTALAPGAWLHASILDSPFSLGVYGVFRPGLRADTTALTVPGAHALQLGVSASVDATLFDLFSTSRSFRK